MTSYETPNKSIVLFCFIYLRGLKMEKKKTRNHACENSHLSLLGTTSDVSSGYTRCVK